MNDFIINELRSILNTGYNFISYQRTTKGYKTLIGAQFDDYSTIRKENVIQLWEINKDINKGYPELYLFYTVNFDNSFITINGINIAEINCNKGFGEVALKRLIENSNKKGMKYITGILSFDDLKKHKDRLLHFYSKLGFDVLLNDNESEGKVILYL